MLSFILFIYISIIIIILLNQINYIYSKEEDIEFENTGSSDLVDGDYISEVKRAGLFTPMGITYGNGERYFLACALAFKKMGYEVDIILFEDSPCFMGSCVNENLKAMNIPLKYEDFRVRLISEDSDTFVKDDTEYDVFLVMGIKKFPSIPIVKPAGKLFNMYFCQFPYDWKRGVKDMDIKTDNWAAYDAIILNSRYSHDWYVQAMVPWIHRGLKRNIFVPSLHILNPPADPKGIKRKPITLPDRSVVTNIAVVGPFHPDGNSIGHWALLFFSDLLKSTSKPVHLFFVGNVIPATSQDEYLQMLRNTNGTYSITPEQFNSQITFLFEASENEINDAISTCTIMWHIHNVHFLGMLQNVPMGSDFSVNLVQTMYTGAIPITPNLGGSEDIISSYHNGFLASSTSDFVKFSLLIMSLSSNDILKMRQNVYKSASSFSTDLFVKNFQTFVTKGIATYPVRNIVRTRLSETWNLQLQIKESSYSHIAVLIVPTLNSLLELVVRNIVNYIGDKWAVQIHHTLGVRGNEAYVRYVLAGVPNLQFVPLQVPIHRPADFNRLLKSPSFWQNFQEDAKILLFTLDSFILRRGIDDYLKYDFVAPPLPLSLGGIADSTSNIKESIKVEKVVKQDIDIKDNKEVKKNIKSKSILQNLISNAASERRILNSHNSHNSWEHRLAKSGLGSSSISIRTAGVMLKIARQFSSKSNESEPEGLFFLRHALRLGLKVPSRQDSYNFAWEAECTDLSSDQMPLAIHGAWMYFNYTITDKFVNNHIIENSKIIVNIPPPPAISVSYVKQAEKVEKKQEKQVKSQITPEPEEELKKSSTPISTLSSSNEDKNLDLAWELIHNNRVVTDEAAMKSVIETFGLMEASDLDLLETSDITKLADLIKPVQKKKLYKYLGKS